MRWALRLGDSSSIWSEGAAIDPNVHRQNVLPDDGGASRCDAANARKRRASAVGELHEGLAWPKRAHRRLKKPPPQFETLADYRKTGDDAAETARVLAHDFGEGERIALNNSRLGKLRAQQRYESAVVLNGDQIVLRDSFADCAGDGASSRTKLEDESASLRIDLLRNFRRQFASGRNG